jgi:outer membrane protein
MYRRGIFLLLCCCWGLALLSQRSLTLDECLRIAVESNIQAKISQNSVESAQLTFIQKKFDFLPSVNGTLPVSKSFGTSLDPNLFIVAKSPWNATPGLTASINAFGGFVKWNNMRNAEQNLLATQYSLEDLKNDIRLNTALAFFQVVFATDNLKIAHDRLALLAQQLEKVQKEVAAGTKTEGDVYNVKAQVATEKVNLITQENNYNRNLLNLILSMNLDPAEEYTLVRPAIMDAPEEVESLTTIFEEAKLNNPGIRKQQFSALAAKYAMYGARAPFMPTLGIGFALGSRYSSANRERIITGYVNGEPVIVQGDRVPLFTQFSDNFYQSMSLQLTIPIFSRFQPRQSYRIAKVNYQSALLNIQAEQIDLYKAVQQAYLDATAAKSKFLATQEQIESLNEAYRYAEAKYQAGLLDFYNYIEVLNNKTKAELESVEAQYDYLLKRKILDLYQGKSLGF